MNSLAGSLIDYLFSRNNDIAGYWGIGMLCATAKREDRHKFSFKIHPGQIIKIYSCELNFSQAVTEKLVKFNLDSIEGRLSFFEDGRYADGADKYTCGLTIAITQDGRTGLSIAHTACWPHDPRRERQSTRVTESRKSWASRIATTFRFGRA